MIVLFGSNFVFFIVIPFGTAHFVCWGSGGGASKKTCCIRNNVLFKISFEQNGVKLLYGLYHKGKRYRLMEFCQMLMKSKNKNLILIYVLQMGLSLSRIVHRYIILS